MGNVTKRFAFLALGLWLGWAPLALAQDVKERLNKILYWSVSDELKLTPAQEKKMVEIIEQVQARRETAYKEREAALAELRKLPKAASADKAKTVLGRYQAALETLTKLESEEYTRLLEVFGVQTLARFYVIRDDVAQRVREALRTPDPPAPKK